MKGIIEFLNSNNGALMVIITIVYVVATVLICIFNYKSSKAANKQLEESKRQFSETVRLNHLPVLTISTTNGIRNISISKNPNLPQVATRMTIKNIGHCTAQLVEGFFDFGYNDEKYEEISRYLAVDELVDCSFVSFYSEETLKIPDYKSEVILYLRFKDLLGNDYEQKIAIELSKSGSTIIASSCTVGEVVLLNYKCGD